MRPASGQEREAGEAGAVLHLDGARRLLHQRGDAPPGNRAAAPSAVTMRLERVVIRWPAASRSGLDVPIADVCARAAIRATIAAARGPKQAVPLTGHRGAGPRGSGANVHSPPLFA
jgi:hypothetical protein